MGFLLCEMGTESFRCLRRRRSSKMECLDCSKEGGRSWVAAREKVVVEKEARGLKGLKVW